MMKPSRLFWKLFLAFWLATSLTFLVGLGVLVLGSFRPGDPHLEAILASEEQLLRQFGVESGRQLDISGPTWNRQARRAGPQLSASRHEWAGCISV